ncbi:hypothetical protein PROFUN_14697 [Planoprotostelium fungivorum]|uniref:UBA domain-containing protein n=1 Tax=Planoprotostelium fungivorum TaxID=1890364 RepID=A0A2P6MZ71_9EUKA|nr:hypothetical protein PROFUN_14697 [Planoprotostelium fungivorum]
MEEPLEYRLEELRGQESQFSSPSYGEFTSQLTAEHSKFQLSEDVLQELASYESGRKPVIPFQYNFHVELETISNIHEQKIEEVEQKRRKQMEAEERAWKSLQSGKKSEDGTVRDLYSLNFESNGPTPTLDIPQGTNHFEAPPDTPLRRDFSSPKHEQVYHTLVELGMSPRIIDIGIDAVGYEDELRLVNFVTDFQRLSEQEYPDEDVTRALLQYAGDYEKAWVNLREMRNLSSISSDREQCEEALSLFGQDVGKAGLFLSAVKSLTELGFEERSVKMALMENDLDREKAAQHLLEQE